MRPELTERAEAGHFSRIIRHQHREILRHSVAPPLGAGGWIGGGDAPDRGSVEDRVVGDGEDAGQVGFGGVADEGHGIRKHQIGVEG